MIYSCASHVGKIRKNNEDYHKGEVLETKDGNIGIFSVADGMGGHNKGEVASEMAVENIIEILKNDLIQNESIKINYIDDILKQAYNDVNSLIYKKSKEDDSFIGMGTTLTTAIVFKKTLYIAHVGDSRCYILTNNKLEKMTKDHSLIEELLSNNIITLEEAKTHPQRNVITRALGTDKMVIVDIYKKELNAEDKILLTSDGLTNELDENLIKETIETDQNIEDITNKLISLANEKSGRDNITAILIKCN